MMKTVFMINLIIVFLACAETSNKSRQASKPSDESQTKSAAMDQEKSKNQVSDQAASSSSGNITASSVDAATWGGTGVSKNHWLEAAPALGTGELQLTMPEFSANSGEPGVIQVSLKLPKDVTGYKFLYVTAAPGKLAPADCLETGYSLFGFQQTEIKSYAGQNIEFPISGFKGGGHSFRLCAVDNINNVDSKVIENILVQEPAAPSPVLLPERLVITPLLACGNDCTEHRIFLSFPPNPSGQFYTRYIMAYTDQGVPTEDCSQRTGVVEEYTLSQQEILAVPKKGWEWYYKAQYLGPQLNDANRKIGYRICLFDSANKLVASSKCANFTVQRYNNALEQKEGSTYYDIEQHPDLVCDR